MLILLTVQSGCDTNRISLCEPHSNIQCMCMAMPYRIPGNQTISPPGVPLTVTCSGTTTLMDYCNAFLFLQNKDFYMVVLNVAAMIVTQTLIT